MSSAVGELIVSRVDSQPVVERADPLILVSQELLDEIGLDDGCFQVASVRYRVIGHSVEHPGAMLCERVA